MTLGHLTATAANRILDGGALPTIYYAQQHTAEPGLAFDENVGPDTRRLAITFLTAAAGVLNALNMVPDRIAAARLLEA